MSVSVGVSGIERITDVYSTGADPFIRGFQYTISFKRAEQKIE